MSRRLLLASGSPLSTAPGGGNGGGPGEVVDPEPPEVPYRIPTGVPYNAPVWCITPTPDNSGAAVHPDVVDFGPGVQWRGYRYWMAVTPYLNSDVTKENPCILASNNPFVWEVPPGLTNPIDADPEGEEFNSDTDLVYDAANDRLVCYWREAADPVPDIKIFAATSTDGVTWVPRGVMVTEGKQFENLISPAVVRRGPNDWIMVGRNASWFASAPLGPWGSKTPHIWSGAAQAIWHLDVVLAPNGMLHMFGNDGTVHAGQFAAVSSDGINWNAGPIIMGKEFAWESQSMYRGTLQLHPNGTHYRIWYSAQGPVDSWRVGYTHMPKSLWSGLE